MITIVASNKGLSYTIRCNEDYLGYLLFDADTNSFRVFLDSRPGWVTLGDLKIIAIRIGELEKRLIS